MADEATRREEAGKRLGIRDEEGGQAVKVRVRTRRGERTVIVVTAEVEVERTLERRESVETVEMSLLKHGVLMSVHISKPF